MPLLDDDLVVPEMDDAEVRRLAATPAHLLTAEATATALSPTSTGKDAEV